MDGWLLLLLQQSVENDDAGTPSIVRVEKVDTVWTVPVEIFVSLSSSVLYDLAADHLEPGPERILPSDEPDVYVLFFSQKTTTSQRNDCIPCTHMTRRAMQSSGWSQTTRTSTRTASITTNTLRTNPTAFLR